MKQKIIPIISILAGVLAFMLSIRYFNAEQAKINAERKRLEASKELVTVIAAAKDIPANTPLTIDDLATVSIAKSTIREEPIYPDEFKQIINRKLIYDLKKGSRILWSDIEGGSSIMAPQLESMVQPGLRAISINVSGANAVSGMVRPKNRVDVLGTFSFPSKKVEGEMEAVTLTILQDVTVLATGNEMAHKRIHTKSINGFQPQKSYSTVTLEVTPREAELLTFAQTMQGRLTLALRNSSDVSFEKDLPEINFDQLENSLPELNEYRQKNIRHKKNL